MRGGALAAAALWTVLLSSAARTQEPSVASRFRPFVLFKTARSGSSWFGSELSDLVDYNMSFELIPRNEKVLAHWLKTERRGCTINPKNMPCVDFAHVFDRASAVRPAALLLERCNVVKHAVSYAVSSRGERYAKACAAAAPHTNKGVCAAGLKQEDRLTRGRLRNQLVCAFRRMALARAAFLSLPRELGRAVTYEALQRDAAGVLAAVGEFLLLHGDGDDDERREAVATELDGAPPPPPPPSRSSAASAAPPHGADGARGGGGAARRRNRRLRTTTRRSRRRLRCGEAVRGAQKNTSACTKITGEDLRAVLSNAAEIDAWLASDPATACLLAQFREPGMACVPCANPWPDAVCDAATFKRLGGFSDERACEARHNATNADVPDEQWLAK